MDYDKMKALMETSRKKSAGQFRTSGSTSGV